VQSIGRVGTGEYRALVHLADLLSLGHHLGQTHGLAFPEMSLPWIGTVGFAAVDLVAAAGLWLRAWWGVMAFLAAAVAQIATHTFCSATFGNHPGLAGFHLATIAIYGVLLIRARPRSLGS
jgi:hypothetical protein